MISRLIRTATLVALFSVSVNPATAQEGASLLTGAVHDSDGGVLPGVLVKVISQGNGSSAEAVTDGEGVYNIPSLAPGPYRVEAALDGFESVSQPVTVSGPRVRADVTLAPSRLTESVVVTAR